MVVELKEANAVDKPGLSPPALVGLMALAEEFDGSASWNFPRCRVDQDTSRGSSAH